MSKERDTVNNKLQNLLRWFKDRPAGKRVLAGATAAAVAAAAFGIPAVKMNNDGIKASAAETRVVTAKVTEGSISTTVSGTGSLEYGDAVEIKIPDDINIEEVLVESGDVVTEGQALATVEKQSLEESISDIQDSISDIDSDIAELDDAETEETVTTAVGGRIKEVNVETGDDVTEVLSKDTSLITISTDGSMAVDISNTDETMGSSVSVVLSDGSTVDGIISRVTGTKSVISIPDQYGTEGESVSVLLYDGTELGSGTLYISQPYQITASGGTVSGVYVTEGEEVDTGASLFYLTDIYDQTELNRLLTQRAAYVSMLQDRMDLLSTLTITSPQDGVIADVYAEAGEVVSSGSSSSGSKTNSSANASAALYISPATETFAVSNGALGLVRSAGNYGIGNLSAWNALLAASETDTVEEEVTSSTEDVEEETETQVTTTEETDETEEADETEETDETEEADGTDEDDSDTSEESAADSTAISGTVEIPLLSPINGVEMKLADLNSAIEDLFDDEAPYLAESLDWEDEAAELVLKARTGYYFDGSGNNTIEISDDASEDEYSWSYRLTLEDSDRTAYDTLTVSMLFEVAEESEEDSSSSSSSDDSEEDDDSSSSSSGKKSSSSSSTDSESSSSSTSGTKSSSSSSSSTSGTKSSSSSSSSSSGSKSSSSSSSSGSKSSSSSSSSGSKSGSGSSSSSGSGSSGSSGSSSSSSGSSATTSRDLYEQSRATAFTLQNSDKMQVTISVDELDILSISEGQAVAISLDAMEGQTFTGEVSSISSGSSSGGVSKYSVTILVPREENMLAGMTASATVTVASAEGVFTVPAAAVQESRGESFVYTELDKDGNPSGQVSVETGLSDGSRVQVTGDLTESQEIYYTESAGTDIEQDEEESSERSQRRQPGGNGGSGGSGNRPSGGGRRSGSSSGGNGGGSN